MISQVAYVQNWAQYAQELRQLANLSIHLATCPSWVRDQIGPSKIDQWVATNNTLLTAAHHSVSDPMHAELAGDTSRVVDILSQYVQMFDPLSQANLDTNARILSQASIPLRTVVEGQIHSNATAVDMGEIQSATAASNTRPRVETVVEVRSALCVGAPADEPIERLLAVERTVDPSSACVKVYATTFDQDDKHAQRTDLRDAFTIRLDQMTVANVNNKLRKKLGRYIDRYATEETIPATELEQDLSDLAEYGAEALKELFGEEGCLLLWQDIGIPLAPNALETAGKAMRSLQISGEDFYPPWDLLAWPNTNLPPRERIWGLNYAIYQKVEHAGRSDTKNKKITEKLPAILLLSNTEAADSQRRLLDTLHNERKITCYPLPAMHERDRAADLVALKEFCAYPAQILHAGCHANSVPRNQPDLDAFFTIDENFDLKLRDLAEFKFTSEPLVFLNACTTGLNPRATADFVRVFLRELGACGVIGTAYDVPEKFGAQFAESFYLSFLNGEKVGTALVRARRHFLDDKNNLLGLLYTAYAEPNIRIDYHSNAQQQEAV